MRRIGGIKMKNKKIGSPADFFPGCLIALGAAFLAALISSGIAKLIWWIVTEVF